LTSKFPFARAKKKSSLLVVEAKIVNSNVSAFLFRFCQRAFHHNWNEVGGRAGGVFYFPNYQKHCCEWDEVWVERERVELVDSALHFRFHPDDRKNAFQFLLKGENSTIFPCSCTPLSSEIFPTSPPLDYTDPKPVTQHFTPSDPFVCSIDFHFIFGVDRGDLAAEASLKLIVSN
jgi:hypothetical protein